MAELDLNEEHSIQRIGKPAKRAPITNKMDSMIFEDFL